MDLISLNTLKNIGLSEKEAKLYSILLKSKSATVNQLVKESSIPRTLIYHHLSKLLEKKLIAESKGNTPAKYFAETPNKIYDILDEQQRQFEKQKSETLNIIPNLKETYRQTRNLPSTRVIEGIESYKKILNEIILDSPTEIMIFFHGENIIFPGLKERENFFNRIKFKKIKCQILINKKEKTKYNDHIEYRKIDDTISADNSHTIIYNNTIVHILINDRDIACLITEHESLASFQKEIFQTLWKQAKDITL